MKKCLLTTVYGLLLFTLTFGPHSSELGQTVFAQSPSSNATMLTQNVDITKQIDDLKNKVASKVAELKLVEKRGLVGVVTDVTDTQITINDLSENVRFIDVDEFTEFSSPEASSSFGISDIKKGDHVGILGLYNKESRRTLARFVNVLEMPQILTGVVSNVDPDNFQITVVTDNGNYTVDIENVTRTFEVGEDGEMVKSGFSSIEKLQNVIVSGFPDPEEKNTITGGRVIIFPNLPQNPSIEVNQKPSPESSPIVPSTGSGKKLTPLNQ